MFAVTTSLGRLFHTMNAATKNVHLASTVHIVFSMFTSFYTKSASKFTN